MPTSAVQCTDICTVMGRADEQTIMLIAAEIMHLWPDLTYRDSHLRYSVMHFEFDMIGRCTSLRTGEMLPYSVLRPHPVTTPVRPTRSSSVEGRQICNVVEFCTCGIRAEQATSLVVTYRYNVWLEVYRPHELKQSNIVLVAEFVKVDVRDDSGDATVVVLVYLARIQHIILT